MIHRWHIFLLSLFLVSCHAAAQQPKTVHWEWWVVSTPDIVGEFEGKAPGFKAPVPKQPLPTTLPVADQQVLGQFEIIVGVDGDTAFEKSLNVSAPEIENQAKSALAGWKFDPASLDGSPIRVRLRVVLSSGNSEGK